MARNPLRRLYGWVLHWADTPYGEPALFALAFAEASFFPVPPDVLLIALALGEPLRAMRFAFTCSVASVAGGLAGYGIGYLAFERLGRPIIEWYGWMGRYAEVRALYQRYDFWAVAVAGFTPIPFKVFTIAGGAFKINLATFTLAAAVSRSARFFLVGGLLKRYGSRVRAYLERYFNLLSLLFMVLLIGGFLVLRSVVK